MGKHDEPEKKPKPSGDGQHPPGSADPGKHGKKDDHNKGKK
ncbi:MAG TPA: hypothetical protein VGM60_24285 [Pseudonocardia sp.]|jgi:hypothetical protein